MKNDKNAADAAKNKFKSTEELSLAYTALEREFTKRCQLIKELQAKLDKAVAKAEGEGSSVIDTADAATMPVTLPDPDKAADTGCNAAPDAEPVRDTEPAIDSQDAEPAATVQDAFTAPETTTVVVAVTDEREPQVEAVAPVPPAAPVSNIAAAETENAVSACDILDEVAERADELSDALSLIPEVMEACIARYKKRLMGVGGFASPRGAAVVAPVKRPRTLADAKLLADEIMRNS